MRSVAKIYTIATHMLWTATYLLGKYIYAKHLSNTSIQAIETYRPRPNTRDEALSTSPSAVKCLSGLNLVGSGNRVSSQLIPLNALSHQYSRYKH